MCHRHSRTKAGGTHVYENILCPDSKRREPVTLCERDHPAPQIVHEGGKENCKHCQQDARLEAVMKKWEKDGRGAVAENQGRAEMGNDGTTEREDNDKKRGRVKKRPRCSVS
jgi:hypothetical protein